MTLPELFPTLPDDIMRFIYEMANLNMDELLALRSVCKRFKEVIDRYLGDRVKVIKNLIQERNFNLKDPIYADFTQQIEALTPFNESVFQELKAGHLERHLTLKDLTPEKLDRTFGYMLQNRSFFRQIFPAYMRHDLDPEVQDKILKYRKYFIEYLMENYSTDNKYLQFHDLALIDQPLEEETAPIGLSQLQEKYGKKEKLTLANYAFHSEPLGKAKIFVVESGLSMIISVEDRQSHTILFEFFAMVLDQHIIKTGLLHLADALVPSLSKYIILHIIAYYLATVIRPFVPYSWNLIRYVERAAYLCPSAREFVFDLKYRAFDTILLVLVIIVQLFNSLLDVFQTRLPQQTTERLRNFFQQANVNLTNERDRMAQSYQEQQLRRQAEIENEQNQ